jgi:hypothetical protein
MGYVAELVDDRRQHRARHAKVMRVLQPRSTKRFSNRVEAESRAARVIAESPFWLQQELYERARLFQREFQYDFPQWSPHGDEPFDANGFLFDDDTETFGRGAIAGGCVFRWRDFGDASPRWTLDWIWITPALRRKGVLSRRWGWFVSKFGTFHIMGPVSDAMTAFAKKNGHPV